MALTDTEIKRAKPAEKIYSLSDSGESCMSTGTPTNILNYSSRTHSGTPLERPTTTRSTCNRVQK
jgi:hypothetical protein